MEVDGSLANDTWAVFDSASKTDANLHTKTLRTHVYSHNPLLREFLGYQFNTVTRIALVPHGAKKVPQEAIDEFLRALNTYKPRRLLVFPTPSKAALRGAEELSGRTHAWLCLKPPASMDEMRGTVWDRNGVFVTAMFPCLPVVDEAQKWMNKRWAQNLSAPLHAPIYTVVQDVQLAILRNMVGKNVTVDIETIDSQDKITALALATDDLSVSVPWDRFQPSREGLPPQPSLMDYGELGVAIFEAVEFVLMAARRLIGHNVLYDLKRLEARGLALAPDWEDTMLMHAIAFPTMAHGLQKAAAHLLPVPPWKSQFKCAFNKDDERAWYYDPSTLCDYNAKDAFYTHQLWKALNPWLI